MSVPITVAIPVGPHPSNKRWLSECLESIRSQTVQPDTILLIDDGANLGSSLPATFHESRLSIWHTPWPSGVAHAFNCGVILAPTSLVVMLGSDDKLLPPCIEHCWEAWQRDRDPLTYYSMVVQYDDGRLQDTACNAAMVHKNLWLLTGGFPIEAAVGMCDTILLSMMMAAEGRLGRIRRVCPEPIYWYRSHPETDTNTRRKWHGIAAQIRDMKSAEVREL